MVRGDIYSCTRNEDNGRYGAGRNSAKDDLSACFAYPVIAFGLISQTGRPILAQSYSYICEQLRPFVTAAPCCL